MAADPLDRDLPDAVADTAAERLLAAEGAAREAILRALIAAHPDHAQALAHLARDLAGAERVLAAGFPGCGPDAPSEIGPYRVLRRLGEGAFGTVFLCEQEQPVRRRVAIKVLRPGAGDRHTLARFAAERQVLALLGHPAIAHVLDAGSLPDRRPFFVMEYVDGEPIHRFCDRKGLSIGARLDLFLDVCRGVAHAHGKGIVHRDLKPANVLVVESEGWPMPKIIDFGIAKALRTERPGEGVHTDTGRVVGTPGYMSPEQAAGRTGEIDERTDVFSLGVILYELLTGELPWGRDAMATDSEPARPSSRVATGSTATTAAPLSRRRQLAAAIRGDLDWITLKALERQRERRYASVAELIADLERHRRGDAVSAGPPSAAYRLRRFVRRHRIPVAAAAVVLLALIGGLVVSLVSWSRQSAARDVAEASFQNALEAIDRMLSRVADALHGAPHMDGLRKELLEDAAELYGRVASTTSGDPRARFAAARAQMALARMSQVLGQSPAAATAMNAALAELQHLAAAAPDDPRYALELAKATSTSGQLLFLAGDHARALAAVDAALGDLDRLLRAAPESPELHEALQSSFGLRGRLLRDRDPKASIAAYRRALGEGQWLIDAGVRSRDLRRSLVFARVDLAGSLYVDGDMQGCERELLIAKEAMAELGPGDDSDLKRQEMEADLARKLALVSFDAGRTDAAIAAVNEEIAAMRHLVTAHPRVASYRASLATAYGNLARFRSASESGDGVIDAFRAAADMLEQTVREFPDMPSFRRSLASYTGNVARAYLLENRARSLPLAEPYVQRALALFEERFALEPDHGKTVDDFGVMLVNAALIARAARRDDEATKLLQRAIDVVAPLAAGDASLPGLVATIADAHHAMAEIAASRHEWREAGARSARAREVLQRLAARVTDHSALREIRPGVMRLEALVAARTGDHAAAASHVDAVIAAFEAGSWQGPMAAADILHACWRTCREREPVLASDYLARARASYRDALAILEARLAAKPSIDLQSSRAVGQIALAELQSSSGEGDAAAELLGEALAVLRRNRDELNADPFADERLADGERLAAELEAARHPRR